MKKTLAFIFINTLTLLYISAEAHLSTQAHNGKVTSLVSAQTELSDDKTFFSAGTDGFIIKWKENSAGEHYQISDLSISKAVKNPAANEIAIYETDSLTMNKITVLDWNNFNKKFSKRFKDTVTCLSYSERGNYLIIGTTAVNGIYILNGKTGIVNKNIKDISGIITMAKTGSSEKSAVMYSPSGFLYYYDFSKGKVIAKFQTQNDLEQPTLFGTGNLQNRFFAGVKNNVIYIIDALSGKILTQTPASSPLIATGNNSDEEGLYYTSSNGKGYSLKLISYKALEENLKKKSSYSIQEGILVKNFMGLKSKDSFTSIAKNQDSIYLGTTSGDIYNMSDIVESETYSLQPITEKMFKNIYDISSDNQNFYFLTEDSIYVSDYETKQAVKIAANQYHTNFLTYKKDEMFTNNIILWSKGTRKDVIMVILDEYSGEQKNIKLFTPKAKLQTVRLFDNKLLYIQGNNSVSIYDLETDINKEIYTGTSLEDAVLIKDTVYIAKSALTSSDSTLIAVNTNTGETVPLKTKGNVVFSLSYNKADADNLFGILMVNQKDDSYTTEVFSFNTNTKFLKSLISINDEDSSAFTSMNNSTLYTNIGKNQVYSFDTKTTRNTSYKRASSIPVKIAVSDRYASILNKDGSISWYNKNSQTAVSNWYLTTENNWWEF